MFPIDVPAERLAVSKLVPHVHAAGAESDLRAGHRGRRELRSALLQSADRPALCERRRQPARRRGGRRGDISPRSIRRTGELAWQQTFDGWGQAGSVVTAGGVVFVGTGSNIAGYLFAYDAKTGELLWKFNTGAGVFSSPSVYMVNGEEFVTVASGGGERGRRGGDLILAFALPKQPSR